MDVAGSTSIWAPVQLSSVRTRVAASTSAKVRTWTHSFFLACPTGEVMFSVVGAVVGVAGAGVVHSDFEPARSSPSWPRG